MSPIALRSDEKLGLGVAVAAHVVLLALLVLQPPRTALFPLPERMTVTLSDDIALQATSPEPQAAPAPGMAPELGEAPPEPAPLVQSEPAPQPAARGKAPAQPAKAPPKPPATAKVPPKGTAGASKIGDDFLKGVAGSSAAGTAKNPPAAVAGPAVKSALLAAVSRELKPRWAAPQGADVDKLVTFVTFNLNPDGSLGGVPKAVRQDGINPTNRAQASRHAEQAVRAVQLAAPFDLPAEYYDTWKRIVEFRFDRKLSQ